jgi:hypothetical protein
MKAKVNRYYFETMTLNLQNGDSPLFGRALMGWN